MLRLVGAAGLVVGVALAAMPAQAAAQKTHAPHKSATVASREKSSSHGKTATRPGGASHEAATVKGAKVAARDPETTSSIGPAANDGLNCNRSRKRLFVDGEGWIIRPVTTCY